MAYKLTPYEKETIILTNEAEKIYTINTYNSALKTKLAEFAEKCPELCKMTNSNEDGGVIYEVVKDKVKIRFSLPLSEERRQALAERARNMTKERNNGESV